MKVYKELATNNCAHSKTHTVTYGLRGTHITECLPPTLLHNILHKVCMVKFVASNRGLNNLCPLLSEPLDHACNIHHLLLLPLLQHMVDGDESASTTYPSTTEHKGVCAHL